MPAGAMPFTPAQTEAQRIARALRRHDPAIVAELVERYQYRLARYLFYLTGRREAVEDLAQETWLRVIDRASQYGGRGRFEAWLFSIARSRALDHLRARRTGSLDSQEFEGEAEIPAERLAAADHLSPFQAAARTQDAVRLAEAMERLGPVYREALLLRFQEELSLQEIAAIAGAPVPTVSSRIQRGLALLRSHMEGGANAV